MGDLVHFFIHNYIFPGSVWMHFIVLSMERERACTTERARIPFRQWSTDVYESCWYKYPGRIYVFFLSKSQTPSLKSQMVAPLEQLTTIQ